MSDQKIYKQKSTDKDSSDMNNCNKLRDNTTGAINKEKSTIKNLTDKNITNMENVPLMIDKANRNSMKSDIKREIKTHGSIVLNNLTKTESDLLNVRVIKKNLIYIVGLPITMTEEILRQQNYFGQYGKINKIIINILKNSSLCAYITYTTNDAARSAIKMVDESVYDGKVIRCTYGTTKYCSFFIKNMPCQNHLGQVNGTTDCMYLHEYKPAEDILTKEELLKSKLHTFIPENKGKEVLGINCKSLSFLTELLQFKNKAEFKRPKKIIFEPQTFGRSFERRNSDKK